MKKTPIFLLLFVVAFFFTSCEKDETYSVNPAFDPMATGDNQKKENGSGNDPNNSPDQFMTATIDGSVLEIPTCDFDTVFFGNFKIVGDFENFIDYRSIRFDFEDQSLPPLGTYDLDSMPGGVSAEYSADQFLTLNDSLIFAAYSGSLIITTATPTLYEGTFSFEAKSLTSNAVVSITNGSFRAPGPRQ